MILALLTIYLTIHESETLTIATVYGSLIDDHDTLVGLEADHEVSEGPPVVASSP